MNIFAFAAAGTYIPPERAKRICFEHSVVYHGTSTRPAGRSFDSLRSGVKGPLLISRSGRFVPQVFSPWPSAVVVSEAVKNRLASFGNLAFVEVQFKHLVDLPLKKGDQSLVKEVKEGFQRSVDDRGEPVESHSQILIDWRPNIPEFHRAIGRYYELLCVLLHEVEDEFPDAGKRPLHVVLDPRPRSILDETVTVSPEMFRQYPLIGDGIMHLCSEAFYEAIAPYVDWDFYLGHWYRVDDPCPESFL